MTNEMDIYKSLVAHFARHWKLEKGVVEFIYKAVDTFGGHYGKTSRFLSRHSNIMLSPRQLKYFRRKVRLSMRYGTDAANYNDLVNKKS